MRIFGVGIFAIVVLVCIGIALEQQFPTNPVGTVIAKGVSAIR